MNVSLWVFRISFSYFQQKINLLKNIRNLSKFFVAPVAGNNVQIIPNHLYGQHWPWMLGVPGVSEDWGSWPPPLEQITHSTSSIATTYSSYCHERTSSWEQPKAHACSQVTKEAKRARFWVLCWGFRDFKWEILQT